MKRNWFVGLAACAAMGYQAPSFAADHADGPQAKADPSSDITDIYAWTSADASKVYLVMNVFPGATAMSKFSTATKYVFHTHTNKSAGDALTGVVPVDVNDVICNFDANQKISCWVVDVKGGGTVKDYVNGDASPTAGLPSDDMKLKVFAGPRDDPFFFNLDGFKNAVKYVVGGKNLAMMPFTKDGAGCVTNVDVAAAVKTLSTDVNGMAPAKDNFAKGGAFTTGNVLSIVIAVDKTLITSQTAGIVGVWGATTK